MPTVSAAGQADGGANVNGVTFPIAVGNSDGVASANANARYNVPVVGNADGVSTVRGTSPVKYPVTVSQSVRVGFSKPFATPNMHLTQAAHVSLTSTPTWLWGRAVVQAMKVSGGLSLNAHYSVSLAQIAKIASAFQQALPAHLAQNFTVHQAETHALGLTLFGRLKAHDSLASQTTYGAALAQAIATSSALQAFLGRGLSQALSVHDAPSFQYVGVVSHGDNLTVASVLANTFMLNATMADTVEIGAAQLLRMIFSGTLSDTIDLSALYVSPQGSTTTWAINTRTNAITEYQNWAFNSFAKMGAKYIAADQNGLYELDGELDLEDNIVSIMRSGMMQMNASKLSGLKGVYLGVRTNTGGDFLLKLIAGDGREYVYSFTAQPNQMTTKVEIGRGLRSRYFTFELQGLGADYDLDTVEFVPLLSTRRV